jgi:multicomponent Na+:H+ antiporter subunit G
MLAELLPWLADALVVIGVVIMTIGVYGVISMPTIYTKLHAASKSAFLGVVSLCLASIVTGDAGIIARVTVIAILVLVTVPVASHAIAQGAFIEGKRMEAERASGRVSRNGDEREVEATPDVAT